MAQIADHIDGIEIVDRFDRSQGEEFTASRSDLLGGKLTIERTGAGGWRVKGTSARSGVHQYQDAEGNTWGEYTPPSVLGASRDQVKGLPITIDHPREGMVTPDNTDRLRVGIVLSARHVPDASPLHSGGIARRIEAVVDTARGKEVLEKDSHRELSHGYTAAVRWESGTTPDGIPYDAIQLERHENHLALVPMGRHGGRVDGWSVAVSSDDESCSSMSKNVDERESSRTSLSNEDGLQRSDEAAHPETHMALARATLVLALMGLTKLHLDSAEDATRELDVFLAEERRDWERARTDAADTDAADKGGTELVLRGDEDNFLALAQEREGLLDYLRGNAAEGEDVAKIDAEGIPALRKRVIGDAACPVSLAHPEDWPAVKSQMLVNDWRVAQAAKRETEKRSDSVTGNAHSGKVPGLQKRDDESEYIPAPLSAMAAGTHQENAR